MTVSRQFLLLLALTFALFVAFTTWLTYQFAEFSLEGARLAQNLRDTTALSQELREGIHNQMRLVFRQFEDPDPLFSEKLSSSNFGLGERVTQYLKMDIGDQERLTVENIKSLHSELGVQALQIFSQLQAGERARAMQGLKLESDLETQIETAFAALSQLQLRKLQTVLDHLSLSVNNSYKAIFGFIGSLILLLGLMTILLRRRILHPLNDLLEASDQLRQGNFSARAPVHNRLDEIGRLAHGFSFMAESLAESYAGLERKVEERTLQLQRMQQQLIRAEKMSAVGQLVNGMAHELNNPLTVVIGFAELAKRRYVKDNADPKTIHMLDDILVHAERCRRVVANLQQFARQVEPHLELARINDLVEQVLQLREYELGTQNIEVAREFDPGNPLLCLDPHKIQQLVLNLVNNARDAIRVSGKSGRIWVRTRADSDTVTLEIADNGTGIIEPGKVFDPFYTTKEVGKGTGLGLSVCYGIVQEHRGKIHAENWEQGARFIVTLPLGGANAVEERQEIPAPATLRKQTRTALVVEDEETILDLQVEYLTGMGLEVHGVNTGEEALEFLREHPVDLIISDVRMPGSVDGVQLYGWVKEHRPELAKHFLFVSGDAVGMAKGRVVEASSVPSIRKPFKFEEYSRLVNQLLES